MSTRLPALTSACALVALASVAWPVPARAQVIPRGARPVEPKPVQPVTPASPDPLDPGPAEEAPPPPGNRGAPVDDVRVPAPDESVYVVQRRAYSKSGKFEITPVFMTAVNPKFVGYLGGGLSVAYHFQENLAVEMIHAGQYAYYSDLVYEVWRYEQLFPQEVNLKQILYFNSLNLQFSALYGKLEFYGNLVDYDFYVTAGLGYALTREPCNDPGVDGCSEIVDVGKGLRFPDRALDAHKLTGNLGLGLRLFFHEMLGARVEFRNLAFADRKVETAQAATANLTTTEIRNTMMLIFGVTVML